MPFTAHLKEIRKNLAQGVASEQSHYPALKTLLQTLMPTVVATNNPKHIACGAPDFIITHHTVPLGYVEAKDVGKSLDHEEQSEQIQRYLGSLNNLVLANFLEFRWYVEGQHRRTARLASVHAGGKVKVSAGGAREVSELLEAFFAEEAPVVSTPRELARRMAGLAREARRLIEETFKQEGERGQLHNQLKAFREVLIPGLDVPQFADMYAQTMAYGLFAARCNAPSGRRFTRDHAALDLPKTNPFLRKLFAHIAGEELDERVAWVVDDLALLLAKADMDAVLKHIGTRKPEEDPVVHFYETFLGAYDPKMRRVRGVYYTSRPVVSFIVRSIDHIVKTRFGRSKGLADPGVLVLDPAAGTGTFLHAVVDLIYDSFAGQRGMWSAYVGEKLLPRLFGFELLMAPYAIAHMKLGLQLRETGYDLEVGQAGMPTPPQTGMSAPPEGMTGPPRLGIYLTNTLDEAVKKSEILFGKWISDEANAAVKVKRDLPIMVVLGNPPYSVSSYNKGEYIEKLMERYKAAVSKERNIQPLSDDYIKFIRFAHDRIERTGHGILAMITNHSYLSGLIHRGMREELLQSFDEVYVLDLHGELKMGEIPPDGGKDKNVFDIKQGVSIGIFVREPREAGDGQAESLPHTGTVYHADLSGTREGKNRTLAEADVSSTPWVKLDPGPPSFFFIPRDLRREQEYRQGWSVAEVFRIYSTGVTTHRDHFVIDFRKGPLRERIATFRGSELSDEEVRERFKLRDNRDWKLSTGRSAVQQDEDWEARFTTCLYRPFDFRHIFYSRDAIDFTRPEVMRHMLCENVGLCLMRKPIPSVLSQILAANWPMDKNLYGFQSYVFPLYLYDQEVQGRQEGLLPGAAVSGGVARRPNLDPAFVEELCERLCSPLPDWYSALVGQTFLSAHNTRLHITRRRLPHWALSGSTYFVTFRMLQGELSATERRTVLEHLCSGDGKFYQLMAATVMPDHVHLILAPMPGYTLSRVLKGVKGVSARKINLLRGTKGPVWQDESLDRIVRDDEELVEKLNYMLQNPVNRGLVEDPWRYDGWYYAGEVDKDMVGQTFLSASTDKNVCAMTELTPEDIFYYMYAVFHSPTYRERYAEFLKVDFPRVPLTSDRELFAALVAKGAELVALHLMDSPKLAYPVTTYPVEGSNVVERVSYAPPQTGMSAPLMEHGGQTRMSAPPMEGMSAPPEDGHVSTPGRVYINRTQYFEGVAPDVWDFHIGGYRVCEKWLKDRRGLQLTHGEMEHYGRIVVALGETIRLMEEIDEAIPSWPIV